MVLGRESSVKWWGSELHFEACMMRGDNPEAMRIKLLGWKFSGKGETQEVMRLKKRVGLHYFIIKEL